MALHYGSTRRHEHERIERVTGAPGHPHGLRVHTTVAVVLLLAAPFLSAELRAGTSQFTYDSLNRLTSATIEGSRIEYQYDAAGNLTRVLTPYAVAVTRTGPGAITDSLGKVDCGTDCSGVYDLNTPVTLTAAAGDSASFGGWTGACSGTGSCVVTVTGMLSVGATFVTSAPAISGIDPSRGPIAGGQTVTITGSGLGGAAVTFGGIAATITSITGNQIVLTTPAHAAGAVDVVVTTPAGPATATAGYTYVDPPTISSVLPAAGPAGGGQSVTISGSGLAEATVQVGGNTASVQSTSQSSAVFTTPPHAASVVDVSVATAGGSATATGAYAYVSPPSVSGVSPAAGPAAGGQTVTVTGTNLAGASVTIGGSIASVTASNATSVTIVTPAHEAGTVDVVVTTPGGSATAAGAYLYVAAPAITALSPNAGPVSGGQIVTATGTNLSAAGVTVGGGTAVVNASTPTSVTFATPAHAAGTVDVVVSTLGGTATSAGGYTYVAAPTITGVSPNSGPSSGGQSVTLDGTGLLGGTVLIGGTAASVTTSTESTIEFTTPVHAAGIVDVIVTTTGGSTTASGAYTFIQGPAIVAITPNTGPVAGGQRVTITGSQLAGASVLMGGNAAIVTASNATSVTLTTPAHSAGAVDVVVTTSGGTATSAGGYTYLDAPAITGVDPDAGPAAGGRTVVITGTNLNGGSVLFGDTPATVTASGATSITATTPAHAPGQVDVHVTTLGGSKTASGAYTYIAAPAISNITPNRGPSAGGQDVTITGTNLNGAAILIGGNSATPTTSSATSITFTTPGHSAGPVDVVITTLGGSATSTGGYTYVAAPMLTGVTPNTGPEAGGQSVTLSGLRLSGATVEMGGQPATVNGTTANSVTLTTPPHSPATVHVVVTTEGGSATALDAYTFLAAPALDDIAPAAGPIAGGQTVTLTGTQLNGASVTIGGNSATVTESTATQVSFTTPAHDAGTVDVTVQTNGGTATLPGAYTYLPPPIIVSTAPEPIPGLDAVQTLTVSGSYFIEGCTATLTDGATSTTYADLATTFVSSSSVRIAHNFNDVSAEWTVKITNPDGSESGLHTFHVQPAISAPPGPIADWSLVWPVLPEDRGDLGVDYGQFDVPLEGLHHAGIDIDAAAGSTVRAMADGYLALVQQNDANEPCTGPAKSCEDHGFGNSVILRHNVNGAWYFTQYSHLAAIEPSVLAACGAIDGGLRARRTCLGSFVAGGTTLGTTGGTCNGLPDCTRPKLHVELKTFGTLGTLGNDLGEYGWTVDLPDLVGYRDPVLNLDGAGATSVMVEALSAGSGVRVGPGGQAATEYRIFSSFASADRFRVLASSPATATPSCTGWYQLRRPDGTYIVDGDLGGWIPDGWACRDTFSVVSTDTTPPVISILSPTAAITYTIGANAIDLSGTASDDVGVQSVDWSNDRGGSGSATGTNDWAVTGIPLQLGTNLLKLRASDNAGNSSTDLLSVRYALPPTVASVNPESGPTSGGTSVSISGTGFEEGASVSFATTPASGVTVTSAQQILATAPAHVAGPVVVKVMNPGGLSGTLDNGFTYAAPPSVMYLDPAGGSTAGGSNVTIHGEDFVAGATVKFGDVSPTDVVVVSGSTITVKAPAHAAGGVAVSVTNPDGQTGARINGYTYIDGSSATLMAGSVAVCAGESAVIPVTLSGPSGALSIQFEATFDPGKFAVTKVEKGAITSAFAIESNVESGRVRVALAADAPGASSGEVAKITVQALSGLVTGTSASLGIESVLVNESTAAGVPGLASCAGCKLGDLNSNGQTNAFDASLILQIVVGTLIPTPEQSCAADFNQSGSVGAFDASLVLQCAVGTGPCS